jgi:hypothetical protein
LSDQDSEPSQLERLQSAEGQRPFDVSKSGRALTRKFHSHIRKLAINPKNTDVRLQNTGAKVMKTVAIVVGACLLAGSAHAGSKDSVIGKQVRLPHNKMGVIVGRAGEGFIIMPAKRAQEFSQPDRQVARE